jgi:vitamin B12 transporter
MSNTRSALYLGAVTSLTAGPAFADNPNDPTTVGEPIVDTATRTARTIDDTLASVTVITREEIERRQVASVPEVLRGVAGLGIASNGGLGKTTSVFLRGTNSDHVLVLIDGIRIGSATLGTAAFQDIPIDQIERIEIVRGPRSSLYGSEAIGGVIQIFTRKGGGALKPSFSVGGGSHATYKVSGGVSGGGAKGWYNLSASRLATSGFNACDGLPFPPGGGCSTFEPDEDGYTNTSGAVRAGYRFDNGLEFEGHLLHAEGDNEFDGTFVNQSDFVQQVVGGKLRFSPTSNWDVTLLGGRSLDESENFLHGESMSVFDTERDNVSFQNDISLATNHILTLGFDYYNDKVDSTTAFTVTSRGDKAGFAQYQGAFSGHDILLGIRHDDNEQFGERTTGNVAWGYAFGKALRLTASWGTAFKAPTFNQLFFPGFGDPNLRPEESETVEAGVSGKLIAVTWSLNSYYTSIDDLIGFADDPSALFGIRAANIDEARIHGLEALASATLWGWDVAANLSWLDPENRGDGPNKGNLLPRRAQTMFRFDLDRHFGPLQIGATVYGEGRRFDDIENTERLAGYVTVDLRAGIELHKHWILEGRVSNLLDKDYETAHLFNQDDRNFFLTLR